jgi:hypothetical protein
MAPRPKPALPLQEWQVDAYLLARVWLAVALAQSQDAERPALYRSTLVEWFDDEGIRLVSTDGYILLAGWLPYGTVFGGFDPAPAPPLYRDPDMVTVVRDVDKRALQLLAYLRSATKGQPEGKAEPIDVTLQLIKPTGAQPSLSEELAAAKFVFEVPGAERLVLGTFDGEFPTWRQLFDRRSTTPVDVIGFGPQGILRLGALSKLFGGTPIKFAFAGPHGPAEIALTTADVSIRGLAMPVRDDGRPVDPDAGDDPDGPSIDVDVEDPAGVLAAALGLDDDDVVERAPADLPPAKRRGGRPKGSRS